MPAIKNFKLRKIYQRKKNFILKNKPENNYILLTVSHNLDNYLTNELLHITYNYMPSYIQTTKLSTGGAIIKLIPINFQDFVNRNNTLKDCISIFYNNRWYPGYILKNIKKTEKNLLPILILLKELKNKNIS